MQTKEEKRASKKESSKRYRDKNKDKIKSYAHEYMQVPEKKAKRNKYWGEYRLKRNYGLTQEDYKKLLEQQKGVCAICGCKPNGKALAVDHNHTTGKIRGLLCHDCNVGIGFLKEDISILQKSIEYLKYWSVEKI